MVKPLIPVIGNLKGNSMVGDMIRKNNSFPLPAIASAVMPQGACPEQLFNQERKDWVVVLG